MYPFPFRPCPLLSAYASTVFQIRSVSPRLTAVDQRRHAWALRRSPLLSPLLSFYCFVSQVFASPFSAFTAFDDTALSSESVSRSSCVWDIVGLLGFPSHFTFCIFPLLSAHDVTVYVSLVGLTLRRRKPSLCFGLVFFIFIYLLFWQSLSVFFPLPFRVSFGHTSQRFTEPPAPFPNRLGETGSLGIPALGCHYLLQMYSPGQ